MRIIEDESKPQRVSVPVTGAILCQVEAGARRAGVSRSAFLARMLRYGLEAEKQKRAEFVRKIRQYRDCKDPKAAEKLGDELGEMIFSG